MNPKEINQIDWSKIFLGIAVAVTFVLQSWHSMQLADVKASVVPRAEYEQRHEKVMDKADILNALEELQRRLETVEKKK